MERLSGIIGRTSKGGMAIGAVFLVSMMLLVVVNIISRFIGSVIVGTYEIVELMILITVTFALSYAAYEKGHVVITLVISKFPARVQHILEGFTSLISMGTWAIIAWAAFNMIMDRWLNEYTEMLKIPYLPFRFIWFFGLIILCIVYLWWSGKGFKRGLTK